MVRASRGLRTTHARARRRRDDFRALRAKTRATEVFKWCVVILHRARSAPERRWDDGWNRDALAENRFGSSVYERVGHDGPVVPASTSRVLDVEL
jgi:hypothetical protein